MTLIEDLEAVANIVRTYHPEQIALASRLREAARRLQRAIAHEKANAGVNEWHAGAASMLAYIVHGTGPLAGLAGPSVPRPDTPKPQGGPTPDPETK